MRRIKELGRSLGNLLTWLRVIWQWRWWDYSYSVDLLEHDLRTRLRYWGTRTHYIGEQFTRGRILVVLQYLQDYREADWREEDKALKKFLYAYARLLPRLWD